MFFRRTTMALSSVAFCASLAAAGDMDHAGFWRTAHVSIDVNGKVTALEFPDSRGKRDIVGEKLGPIVRSWLFEPGRVDGKPAATQTGLILHMDMRKADADNITVSLLSADTGATLAEGPTPLYPSEQLRNGVEAQILLHVDFNADGKVVKTSVEEAAGSGSSWDTKALIRTAQLQAGSMWHFRTEVVGGHAIAGAALVPVSFCLAGAASRCPALQRQVAQHRAEHGLQTPSTQPMVLDRQARLLTQVGGTTL